MTMIDKRLVNLTDEYENQLAKLTVLVMPNVDEIVERVCSSINYISATKMLEPHSQQQFFNSYKALVCLLFKGTEVAADSAMNRLGQQYAKQGIPVEFITSAMALIHQDLLELITETNTLTCIEKLQSNQAITAIVGYCQMHIQHAYSEASLQNELTRFLKVTGISKKLFDNLAVAKIA